jgi:hypothetical protein
MNIAELKEFLQTLPEEFDSYEIVNAEIGVLDEENYYRKDMPVTTLFVDEDTQELVFAMEAEEEPEKESEV